MTDGNTAVQVSPVSQESDDMGKIREVFDRALNAIVQATELSKQVQELAGQVQGLKSEVEKVRSQNNWLDEQLTNVRATRDKALQDLASAQSELAQTKAQNEGLQSRADSAEHTIASLRQELEQTRKDRDDHAMHGMELEDKLAQANAIVDKVRALIPTVPVAQPVQASTPAPVQAQPEPTPPPPAPDYHQPEPVGHNWDNPPSAQPYDPSKF